MIKNNNAAAPKPILASRGERMIKVSVRFWTNKLAGKDGYVIPKHAWDAGIVKMPSNSVHGIKQDKWKVFHSLPELAAVVAEVLAQQGVTLHPGRQSQKTMLPTHKKQQ